MPVYLLHGFRWPREGFNGIRVRAIVHNLEDCSVDYIQNVNSATDLLRSFRTEFPVIMKELESTRGRTLQFLEQHDPDDVKSEASVCQPFAFVADRVVVMADMRGVSDATLQDMAGKKRDSPEPKRLSGNLGKVKLESTSRALSSALSVNLEDVIAEGPGLTAKAWDALADLRDKIAEGEKIGWWVVYNGDPVRAYEDSDDDGDDEEDEDDEESDDGTEHEQAVNTAYGADTDQTIPVAPGLQAPSAAILDNAYREKEVGTTSQPSQRLSREMPPPTSIPPRPASKRASKEITTALPTHVSPPQSQRQREPKQEQQPQQQSPIATSPQGRTPTRTEGLKKKLFGRKSSSST